MEKMTSKELAAFRVGKPGCTGYFTMQMDAEEACARRMYLRKVLAAYPEWENLKNEALDGIRVYAMGEGMILEDGKGYEYFLPAVKVTSSETEFRRVRAMMPFDFLNATGADFKWDKYHADTSQEKELIIKYILRFPQFREKGMGLYIYSGTKGSGKTMLSCCLLNEIAKRHKGSMKFVNVLDFLEMTKKSYDGDEQEINAIHNASLLVIDDIGVQMTKEWTETVLYMLVNGRYSNRFPTVYTSNVPIEGLKLDDRITDRIESTTFTVKLPEESIRKAVRQQEKKLLLEEIEGAGKE